MTIKYRNHHTNPNHHNAGRVGTFNQDLTRHLSFLNMQLKGFQGNVSACIQLLSSDIAHTQFMNLPQANRESLYELNKRLRRLTGEISDLADDVAEFNRDKHKIPGLKTIKVKHPVKGGG